MLKFKGVTEWKQLQCVNKEPTIDESIPVQTSSLMSRSEQMKIYSNKFASIVVTSGRNYIASFMGIHNEILTHILMSTGRGTGRKLSSVPRPLNIKCSVVGLRTHLIIFAANASQHNMLAGYLVLQAF